METNSSNPSGTASVVAQIANLPQLGMPELKALWQRLFSYEAATHNCRFLERRIAYQLQLLQYVTAEEQRLLVVRNQQRINQWVALEQAPQSRRSVSHALIPGTILTRHYQDVDHQVIVQERDCFIYQSKSYNNLSQIAREITGTRWSGPLFFGLKERTKSSTHAKPRGC